MAGLAAPGTARAADPGLISAAVDWETATGPVDYGAAVARMEARAEAIRSGGARELVWLLEHRHVYTAGTSASADELLATGDVPVVSTGRGGRTTYHGPGQRIVYLMLDLARRGQDLHRYVTALESWVIAALGTLGLEAFTAPGRVGVWTMTGRGEEKIAAVGIRVRRWVTYHGVAINIDPELGRFDAIVPCGIRDFGVTSLSALGLTAGPDDVDGALGAGFEAFLAELQV